MHNPKIESFYSKKSRFWELDLFRGIAIILMVIFHIIWTMDYFNLTSINFYEGITFITSRTTASVFLLLVGICLTISYSKTKENVVKKYVWRGLQLMLWGMLVTLASFFLPKGGTVIFGVLHLIGFSIILSIPFLSNKWLSLTTGIATIILGLILTTLTISSKWFVWLGLTFSGFYTVDYFPLFPWFGVVLIGIFVGNTLYKDGKRKFKIKPMPNSIEEIICFIGRYSLIIYFLHMIIILGILKLLI